MNSTSRKERAYRPYNLRPRPHTVTHPSFVQPDALTSDPTSDKPKSGRALPRRSDKVHPTVNVGATEAVSYHSFLLPVTMLNARVYKQDPISEPESKAAGLHAARGNFVLAHASFASIPEVCARVPPHLNTSKLKESLLMSRNTTTLCDDTTIW